MKLRKLVRDACIVCISYFFAGVKGDAIDDFTYIGQGICQGSDVENNLVDFQVIFTEDGIGGTNLDRAEACAIWCTDTNIFPFEYMEYLIGLIHFRQEFPDYSCYCLFVYDHAPPVPPEASGFFGGPAVGGLELIPEYDPYHCWEHDNYGSVPQITLFATLLAAEITLDQCDASAANTGLEAMTCAASIGIPFEDGQLKVAIEENHCIENGPNTASGATGVNTNVGVSVTTGVDVSASEISSGTDNGDGTRSVVKYHCFRADLYPTEVGGSTSTWSALAKKWNVTSTFTYDMYGDFEVEVVTDAFTPSFTSDSESRAVHVFANDNACGNTGSAGPYSINSVMTVCAWVGDSDVIISGVKNVKMQLQGSSHEVIVVDEAPNPSFVTSLSGGTEQTFEIKTLLLPEIFDQFGGISGSVTFVGTCLLTYTNGRRLSGNQRILEKEEEVPFSLKIQVEAGGDAPKIAQFNDESGSHQLGVGIAAFGVGMAAMI